MNKIIEKILKLSDHLDMINLTKEADVLDSVLKKIALEAEEGAVDLNEKFISFINENFANPKIPTRWGDDGNAEYFENLYDLEKEDLKVYMEEILPDLISELAEEVEMHWEGVRDEIYEIARGLELYQEDDDFKYIIQAFWFYLKDYVVDGDRFENMEVIDD